MTNSQNVSHRVGKHKNWFNRGYLPHVDQPGRIQFVTIRLHDSLPEFLIAQWKQELGLIDSNPHFILSPMPTVTLIEMEVKLLCRIREYEDAGHGSCLLRNAEIAEMVEDTLLFFDGERYQLLAWCIMPNHLHVLFEPVEGFPLSGILHSWKSYSTNQVQRQFGHRGSLWMREYFDRYIRNEEHFLNTVSYIENNPVKAGLIARPEEWRFCSAWARAHGAEE